MGTRRSHSWTLTLVVNDTRYVKTNNKSPKTAHCRQQGARVSRLGRGKRGKFGLCLFLSTDPPWSGDEAARSEGRSVISQYFFRLPSLCDCQSPSRATPRSPDRIRGPRPTCCGAGIANNKPASRILTSGVLFDLHRVHTVERWTARFEPQRVSRRGS